MTDKKEQNGETELSMEDDKLVPISDSEIGTRISAASASVNGKRNLANMITMSESQLHRVIGGSAVKAADLAEIAEATGFSLLWLATGQGPQKMAIEDISAWIHLLERFHGVEEPMPAYDVASVGKGIATVLEDFALVPDLDIEVSAGSGSMPGTEDISRSHAYRLDWLKSKGLRSGDLVTVTAKGDSMEPTIKDGASLLINTADKRLTDGRVYCFRIGDSTFVKRVQRSIDQLQLISDNQAYPPITLGADTDSDQIIGRVVNTTRDL